MKRCLTIAMSVAVATAAVRGQDLATYQSTVTGQSPYYYNHLDDSLVPSIGVGTFAATGGTGFTNDYFGNANDAAYFTNTTAQLSDPTGTDEIYNSGVANANSIGSLSLLFYNPNTNGNVTTRYIFSNGDTSGSSQFYLKLAGTNVLVMAAGNKSSITDSTALVTGMWYYFAATWNFSGANSNAYGINYYVGAAGGNSLSSGFTQRGGSGNIGSTAILGNGGTFDLSGTVEDGGGFQVGGVPGMVDELATWNTQLSPSQIQNQYNTLIIPEPATFAMVGIGGLLLLFARKSFRRSRE